MKKWFFLLCVGLSVPIFSTLPPLAQSSKEIQALVADSRMQTSLGSAEGIQEIVRTTNGYVVITPHYSLRADIEYLPLGRPGPVPFQFHFYEPVERVSMDAGREREKDQ